MTKPLFGSSMARAMWSTFFSICRQRPQDALAFSFLVISAILTYIYGTFQILPIVVGERLHLYLLISLLTTWNLVAFFSNMFLIRMRHSSIANRMLLQPCVKPPPMALNAGDGSGSISMASEDDLLRARTKYLSQQFMAQPFGEEEPWHICATCEIFVPPKSWHCNFCKTCILRRDHHCIFTMSCIGVDNHANFLGLLLYIGSGTAIATTVNLVHTIYFTDTALWMYFFRAFMPFYTLLFDFSVINLLSGFNLIGGASAWGILLHYLMLALKGQTSADGNKCIARAPVSVGGWRRYSLANLERMLGPHPFLKIIWPFHSLVESPYEQPQHFGNIDRKVI